MTNTSGTLFCLQIFFRFDLTDRKVFLGHTFDGGIGIPKFSHGSSACSPPYLHALPNFAIPPYFLRP